MFREIFNCVPEAIYVIDLSAEGVPGLFIKVNDGACKMLGYSQEEFLSMSLKDLYPGKNLKDHEILSPELLSKGKWQEEGHHIAKDGTSIAVAVNVHMLNIDHCKRLVVIARDITDRSRARELLQEREYFFRESQKAALIGSYKTDFIKGFWESSEVLDQIFGIDQSYNRSVQGWLELVYPDDREMMAQYLNDQVIAKRKPFNKEYRVIRKSDGEMRWVNGFGQVTFDNNGNILSMIGTIQDISERKKVEEEKLNIQTQLIHSSKLASIGTLAAGVAHEINNPLAIISGYAEIMKQKCKELCLQGDTELIQKIIKASARIAEIVSGLRTYARQDSETVDDIDLHVCINETLSLVKGIYEKENIKIETHLNAMDFILKANMGKLQQVILNILGNAKDALDKRKNGLITITTQNNHDDLLLIISDNGCGIPKPLISQIFDPFFTTKEPGKGTGLGLSICHTIITAFGGSINVESGPNIGSSFKILLPSNRNIMPASERILHLNEEHCFSGKVLVVDDEENIRDILAVHLSSLGFIVALAENGESAYHMILKNHYDYVITDMQMPRMNGDELLHRIKSEKRADRTKFLVITGRPFAEYPLELRQSLEGTVDGYISKPFQKRDLINSFKSIMK
ncbi:MAG: PAS domain S-box protein [Bdellovibrio sp.]|nr:PAS domain S-box protein [Bdellovibrio sp.]